MTTLIAWVGSDQRGPSSLNLASDSRITWNDGRRWDRAQKIYAAGREPLLIGYCGDVYFPALVLPGIISRVDSGIIPGGGRLMASVQDSIRREWREYPVVEQRTVVILIAVRVGSKMNSEFLLTRMKYSQSSGSGKWSQET